MIPLAQLLADQSGDDFVPFRAPVRRVAAPAQAAAAQAAPAGTPLVAARALEKALPRLAAPPMSPRALPAPAAAAARAPAAPLRPVSEPRVPLRELEAERQRWADEREGMLEERDAALAEALAEARRAADEEAQALRQDLERASQERIEAMRRQLAAEHAATLTETRKGWVDAEGDRLADLVVLQMAVFEEALKTTLTQILRPLVLDARKRQTVDELAGAVKTIAFDGAAVKIAASGPSDLLEALETKLGDHARHVSFAADEAETDIRIDANQTVIETRLAAWLKAVEEALS